MGRLNVHTRRTSGHSPRVQFWGDLKRQISEPRSFFSSRPTSAGTTVVSTAQLAGDSKED